MSEVAEGHRRLNKRGWKIIRRKRILLINTSELLAIPGRKDCCQFVLHNHVHDRTLLKERVLRQQKLYCYELDLPTLV